MGKIFNVNADCKPELHYMVDIESKLEKIKDMIDKNQYFTINRARQYGKTTTLKALGRFLQKDYIVVSMDFQMMSYADFETEKTFVEAFAREAADGILNKDEVPEEILNDFQAIADGEWENAKLAILFRFLSKWCGQSKKPIVMMIDEVDTAANNQVFLDFLAQLRGYYIKRDIKPAFQSVILAGVYDVKNIKRKLRREEEHKFNSPWNIAADFLVDMSFSVEDIAGMIDDYENDYHIGMNVREISCLLYDYTSGYPFLVSRICKLIDERIAGSLEFPDKYRAWTKEGFLEAIKILLAETNSLFESLVNKLEDFPELKGMLFDLLFKGKEILYVVGVRAVETALMFGFVKKSYHLMIIANRIFEIFLYNLFLASPDMQQSEIYNAALREKNQFVQNGHLDMKLILEKFVVHFDEIYGDRGEKFAEDDGRRYFILYLKPIINGTGNYYIEARTRNLERTDIIVDYLGEQFVIETKIWRGNTYHMRGELQLINYLEHYHLKKGYMLSFNFNKKKEIGVKHIVLGDKVIVEAVV